VRRGLAGIALLAAAVLLPAGAASAHPLGNFTVNTYLGLRIQPDQVVIDMVVDMAEIPAIQARRGIDGDGDGKVSDEEGAAYAARTCPDVAQQVDLTVEGRRTRVRSTSAEVTFPAGTAGLPTLRLTCGLVADTSELRSERQIEVTSTAFTDRVGWREITAVGDRTTLVSSNVPGTSNSGRLTAYPDDLLSSPPDQRTATVRARPGGPPAPAVPGAVPGARVAQPRGLDGATRAFTDLVARQQLSVGFGILALGLAVGLGAIHAFAPGHGKTVMAAYLVGQRGTLRQAAVIGLTVTATHTAGVLVLGVVLSASTSLAPETIYPWLGLASGLLLGAIGASLLFRAVRHRPLLVSAGGGHGHGHGDGHSHTHSHDHGHSHDHAPHDHQKPVDWRSLVPLGLAGGMVPSPSAIVVLLGAIALGRAWFGVALVVAYGVGMAVTLTGAGVLLVRARGAIERRLESTRPGSRRLASVAAALPVLTATAIIVAGVFLAFRGVTEL
jgi:ABC-type nickel/cobalt efflux system permease component RcnA